MSVSDVKNNKVGEMLCEDVTGWKSPFASAKTCVTMIQPQVEPPRCMVKCTLNWVTYSRTISILNLTKFNLWLLRQSGSVSVGYLTI